jgi:RimJ/RimL family protein N-acetyltransferase
MPCPAPTLATERLILSAPSPTDLDDSTVMWSDPAVTRHIGGRPFSREETWARILRYVGHWHTLGYGFWIVRERGDGRHVGEVGLADFRREIEPSFDGAPEVGWALSPAMHGKGYATEAVKAALDWHAQTFGPQRTVCLIDSENAASLRVAERCGFTWWRDTLYRGAPTRLFERRP